MRKTTVFLPILLLVLATGCAINSKLQPSTYQRSMDKGLPWLSYEEAANAAQKIEIGQTTLEDLKKLGLDPFSLPNTEKILDVRTGLLPRLQDTMDTLPPEAQVCYRQFVKCEGYKLNVEIINSDGRGSVVLRAVNIKKEDLTTGWRFKLDLYVLPRKYLETLSPNDPLAEDKVVVLMLVGGIPVVQNVDIRINPLGFLGPTIGVGSKFSPVPIPNLKTE